MNNFTNIQGKKVLITGNTGFKGSWLTFFLKKLDCKIYGVSDQDYKGIFQLSEAKKVLEKQYYLDFIEESSETIAKLLEEIKPDIIFHFAAQSLVKKAAENPIKTIEINSLGTIKLLEAANKIESVKLVTIATTDKVYAIPENLNTEEDSLHGSEFYSASKVAAENFISAFINSSKRIDLNILTIRSGNVIGGGDRGEARIIPDIISAIYNNLKVQIRNPYYIRPWTYILDSLNGYLLASEYCIENKENEIFNLNSEADNKHNVLYVLNQFLDLNAFEYEIKETSKSEFKEVETLKMQSQKARNLLGWESKYNLKEIIKLIYDWENYYTKQKGIDYTLNEIEKFLTKN